MIKEIFINTIRNDTNLVEKKNKTNTGSFIEILGFPSTQSFTIRLGNTIEKCFKEYVRAKGFSFLESTAAHQLDLFFVANGVRYYFEIKNNVNLDTEKTIATAGKIRTMKNEADIVGCLSFRSSTRVELSRFAKPALVSFLYGYNDFFALFGDTLNDNDNNEILECIKEAYIKQL